MMSEKERYDKVFEFERMTDLRTFEQKVNNPDYRFIWALERVKEGSILDVGSGQGILIKLCQKNNLKCDGVEISDLVRKEIRKNCGNGFELFDDISKVKNNSYDNVICLEVLEHVINPKEFFSELFRVLKPEGKLLLTVPLADVPSLRDPMHRTIFYFYDLFDLAMEKTPDFKIYMINKFRPKGSELNLYALEAVKH